MKLFIVFFDVWLPYFNVLIFFFFVSFLCFQYRYMYTYIGIYNTTYLVLLVCMFLVLITDYGACPWSRLFLCLNSH